MLFNKDIAKIIKKLYKENYDLSPNEQEELNAYLSEGATVRKAYSEYLYNENQRVIEKIAKLLETKKYENSGFSFTECNSIISQCCSVIKYALRTENLEKEQQKEAEICERVLYFICENMQADQNSTSKNVERLENLLDEIDFDKKCLTNFKEMISGEEQAQTM